MRYPWIQPYLGDTGTLCHRRLANVMSREVNFAAQISGELLSAEFKLPVVHTRDDVLQNVRYFVMQKVSF